MSLSSSKRLFTLSFCAVGAAFILGACGGGGSDPVITKLSVTPALGAVYGGVVSVFNSSGVLLGTATTSATDGKAEVNMSNYSAGTPVVIKVNLPVGASYFDEKTGANVAITSANTVSLLSVMPAVATGQAVGVTPITNMAARLSGLTTSSPGTVSLARTLTAESVYTAVATTNLVLGLPANTNILAAPAAATAAAPLPTETLGRVLAVMAKNTSAASAVAQANELVSAITPQGTIDTTKTAAIEQVNSTLRDPVKAAGITLVVTTANTAPTAAQVTAATSAVTAVINAARPTGATGAGG
jgi:hypothetical protein